MYGFHPGWWFALLIFWLSTDQFPNFLHIQGTWSFFFFSYFGTECEGCKSLNSFLWEVERGLKYINIDLLLAHAWAWLSCHSLWQSAKLEIVGIHTPHPHTALLTHASALSSTWGQNSSCCSEASPLPHCVVSHGHKAISAVLLKDSGTRVPGYQVWKLKCLNLKSGYDFWLNSFPTPKASDFSLLCSAEMPGECTERPRKQAWKEGQLPSVSWQFCFTSSPAHRALKALSTSCIIPGVLYKQVSE